jgi:hypothetical protein
MCKRTLLFAVVLAVMSAGLLGGASIAQADKQKPKPKPAEYLVVTMENVFVTSFQTDGSQGPELTLNGRLHLVSQALFDGGTPIGFRLQTNLMDAFASNVNGTENYVAVGSSDGIPADCTEPCLPPSWTLTFRLVPMGSAGQPHLLFELTVNTAYGADGSLESACVVGQDDCGVIP